MKINIDYNKKIHDAVCGEYDDKHTEIYNDYEQSRLENLIGDIVEMSGKEAPLVLDVGAGTGNLTHFFLKQGSSIVAADVSVKSLDFLRVKFSNFADKISVKEIKDENLPFDGNLFDITATYSVLHHVPDYLNTVKEMIRVTKAGGIIYIDHEANENVWVRDVILRQYLENGKETIKNKLIRLLLRFEILNFRKWKHFFIEKFINPRFQPEGDIHVWQDDHIEWNLVREVFVQNDCEIIEEKDYLLYDSNIPLEVFNNFKNRTNNTKYILAKKK